MSRLDKVQIAPEMIDEFLLLYAQEGRTEGTIRVLRDILRTWYRSLPEDKLLTSDALEVWERHERGKEIAEETIRVRVQIVKRFLKYLEDPASFSVRKGKIEEPAPEKITSREEYLLLLQTAKEMGYRRTYLLIKTIVSLNPIMIDGTGMCGGCRVTVGGKIKFACVDGPDFDGHEVDLD